MKKTLTLNLIAVFIVTLLLPSQVFAVSNNQASIVQTPSFSQKPGNLVKVLPALDPAGIKSIHTSVKQISLGIVEESCQVKVQPNTSLLQETEVINLNVPASCFTLSVNKPDVSSIALVVKPLAGILQKIIPPINQLAIQAPVLDRGPIDRNVLLISKPVFYQIPESSFNQIVELKQDQGITKAVIKLSIDFGFFQILRC